MYYNYSIFLDSYLPFFGGIYGGSSAAGAFYLRVDYSPEYSYISLGGRLIFL